MHFLHSPVLALLTLLLVSLFGSVGTDSVDKFRRKRLVVSLRLDVGVLGDVRDLVLLIVGVDLLDVMGVFAKLSGL
jgi:hypothetical protein